MTLFLFKKQLETESKPTVSHKESLFLLLKMSKILNWAEQNVNLLRFYDVGVINLQ